MWMQWNFDSTRRLLGGGLLALMLTVPGAARAVSVDFNLNVSAPCSLTTSCMTVGGDSSLFASQAITIEVDYDVEVEDGVFLVRINPFAIPDVSPFGNTFSFDVVAPNPILGIFEPATGFLGTGVFQLEVSRDDTSQTAVLPFFLSSGPVTRPACGSFVGDVQSGSPVNFETGSMTLLGSVCGGHFNNPVVSSLMTMVLSGTLNNVPIPTPEPSLALLGASTLAGLALVRRRRS